MEEREGGRRKGEYGEKGEDGGGREWEEEEEERTGIYIVLMRIIEARYECLCYGTSTVCVTHVQYTTLTHSQRLVDRDIVLGRNFVHMHLSKNALLQMKVCLILTSLCNNLFLC